MRNRAAKGNEETSLWGVGSPRPLSLSKKTLVAAAFYPTVSAQNEKTGRPESSGLLVLLLWIRDHFTDEVNVNLMPFTSMSMSLSLSLSLSM